jgi:hypothetical protein
MCDWGSVAHGDASNLCKIDEIDGVDWIGELDKYPEIV